MQFSKIQKNQLNFVLTSQENLIFFVSFRFYFKCIVISLTVCMYFFHHLLHFDELLFWWIVAEAQFFILFYCGCAIISQILTFYTFHVVVVVIVGCYCALFVFLLSVTFVNSFGDKSYALNIDLIFFRGSFIARFARFFLNFFYIFAFVHAIVTQNSVQKMRKRFCFLNLSPCDSRKHNDRTMKRIVAKNASKADNRQYTNCWTIISFQVKKKKRTEKISSFFLDEKKTTCDRFDVALTFIYRRQFPIGFSASTF